VYQEDAFYEPEDGLTRHTMGQQVYYYVLNIRKMQIKITVILHFTFVSMAIIKKSSDKC
jgi:lipoate-protein ligase B